MNQSVKAEDPVCEFMKVYTLKDAVYDMAKAWDSITTVQIQNSFENVLDVKLFLEIKKDKFDDHFEWQGINFKGFGNQEAISQRNKDIIETLRDQPSVTEDPSDMDEPTDDYDIQELTNSNNLNVVLKQLDPPQNITAESILDDIRFDPITCLDLDHEIIELLSGVNVTESDEFEHDLLETVPSGSNQTSIVNMFSSFNNFKTIANNYASDFTSCDQILYENLSDQMNQLLLRYVKDSKLTKEVIADLPDLNESITSEYINEDNTINVSSTSSQPSSSIESTISTTFRPVIHKNGNWKRHWKREMKEPADEQDSDTATLDLCQDTSEDNLLDSEETDGPIRHEELMSIDTLYDVFGYM